MKPSARLVKVLATVALSQKGDTSARPCSAEPDAETVTRWRVLPTDLDLFGHMTNSRYLLLMDYARIHYLGRLGLLRHAVKDRWVIPVGSAQVDFRRSLKPFQEFEIGTRVLSWNDRWIFMSQTFRCADSCAVATAHVKITVRTPRGTVAPADVVALVAGEHVVPPPLDDDTRARFVLPPVPARMPAGFAALAAC